MFFFFEQLIDWFKTKQANYELSMQKWIKAGDDGDGYNYRSERDYRHRYGESPIEKLKKVGQIAWISVLCVILLVFCIWITSASVARDETAMKEAYAGKNCKGHNMDDRVKVQYGDWADATGVIVGGCDPGEDYQIKLDKQMYNVANDGDGDPVLVEGRVLSVDTYRNLIKIKKE